MNKTLIITILVAILGIYLLGQGITGLVISQSCCFPPNCDEENMCNAATKTFKTPWTSYLFIVMGVTLTSVAFVSYMWPRHTPDV